MRALEARRTAMKTEKVIEYMFGIELPQAIYRDISTILSKIAKEAAEGRISYNMDIELTNLEITLLKDLGYQIEIKFKDVVIKSKSGLFAKVVTTTASKTYHIISWTK